MPAAPRPRIRIDVRESPDKITAARAAEAWPPPDVEWTELHPAAVDRRLALATEPDQIKSPLRSGAAKPGGDPR